MNNQAKPDFDFIKLLNQGIIDAKGSSEALSFLRPEDIISVGKSLADREADIQGIFSTVITPVNSLVLAIKEARYWSVSDFITEDLDLGPLGQKKRVYFVPVVDVVEVGKEEEYLNSRGLTMCENAPQYLLGLMTQISDHDFDKTFGKKDIVAIGGEGSVFTHPNLNKFALYTSRGIQGKNLNVIALWGHWFSVGRWFFIAEKMKP